MAGVKPSRQAITRIANGIRKIEEMPVNATLAPTGQQTRTPPVVIAKITGGTGPYDATQQIWDASADVWVDKVGGLEWSTSELSQLREVNETINIAADTIVRVLAVGDDTGGKEWVFLYSAAGGADVKVGWADGDDGEFLSDVLFTPDQHLLLQESVAGATGETYHIGPVHSDDNLFFVALAEAIESVATANEAHATTSYAEVNIALNALANILNAWKSSQQRGWVDYLGHVSKIGAVETSGNPYIPGDNPSSQALVVRANVTAGWGGASGAAPVAINPATAATFLGWFRMDSWLQTWNTIFSRRYWDASNNHGWFIRVTSGGQVALNVIDTNGVQMILHTPSGLIGLGEYHQIGIVNPGTGNCDWRVFLDGSEITTWATETRPGGGFTGTLTGNTTFYIGNDGHQPGLELYSHMMADEITSFTAAKTPADFIKYYNSGRPRLLTSEPDVEWSNGTGEGAAIPPVSSQLAARSGPPNTKIITMSDEWATQPGTIIVPDYS